ncbi:QCR9 protein, partial [Polypterus senegalus]
MALTGRFYNLFFKRTSVFTLSIVVGTVLFERVFDQAADGLFEQLNRGVSSIGERYTLENDLVARTEKETLSMFLYDWWPTVESIINVPSFYAYIFTLRIILSTFFYILLDE